MADQIISQEYLHTIFDYKDGELFNKTNRSPNQKIGEKAGKECARGYKRVMVLLKMYQFHHIIYFYHYGILPKVIDHIDGNPKNNCIENLRLATFTQNSYNAKLRKDNSSGHKNVFFYKNFWKVQIRVNGNIKYFGTYKDIDYAVFVAEAMRYKYHKEFSNNGK